MTTVLRGVLGAQGVDVFINHAVTASFEERIEANGEGEGEGDGSFAAGRRDALVDADGRFHLELPVETDRRGPVVVSAIGPDGLATGEVTIPEEGPFLGVRIEIDRPSLTTIPPNPDLTLGQQTKYTGRAIDPQGRGVARDLLVVIWATHPGDIHPAPVSVTRTTAGGYFSGLWPTTIFTAVEAVISGSEPIRIALDDDGRLPLRMVLVAGVIPAPLKHEDCDCPDSPARAPDQVDLTGNAEAYAADAQRCVDFTIPNRTLDEVTYQAVVRTTQPQLKGSVVRQPPTIPGPLIDRLADLARLRPLVSTFEPSVPGTTPEPAGTRLGNAPISASTALGTAFGSAGTVGSAAGAALERRPAPVSTAVRSAAVLPDAIATAQRLVPGIDLDGHWASTQPHALARRVLDERAAAGRPLQLDASVLADLVREERDITPLRLVTAEHTSVVRRFRRAVGLLSRSVPGRFTLDAEHQVEWDEILDAYQATTIAHGHLLTMKQVWRADGYSLGDLLYSLPLAPGQQKLISVLDWNRSEVSSRRAARTETEDLVADLSHDRDISDVISSSLTESMRGKSRADVEAAGGGIAGFIGPLVFGAAGGVSSAGSSASQTSARAVTGLALNQVRDRTLQSASAVRSQRSTVVQTARQGESVRAETEVVANYNHCHALTVEYFEVLRHLQVSQELAAVQECLFVPFAVSAFTPDKALRWRESLARGLRRRELAPNFDSLERVRDSWAGADMPEGRYADELLSDLDGDLWARITLPRPADADDDGFVASNWELYRDLLWDDPDNIWERYLGVVLPASRNRVWDTRIAPGIAQRLLETMTMALIDDGGSTRPVGVDPSMVGLFAQDRPLLVGLQASIPLPVVLRSQIDRVRLSLAVSNLPPGARVLVDSGSMRYRTAHLSHHLFLHRRILNDLSLGDDVEIPTPLDTVEKRNPRALDRRLANRLLDHLDEHIEHYHRAIWLTMDPNRRYMLLDGFVAPDAGGRSVASVVENRIVGVVGNSLVMPVAPGLKLDSTYEFARSMSEDLRQLYAADPAPPMRISMPTSGVFAEAVLGKCNSCEAIDDTRFRRWEEAPIPDRPPSIDPLSTGSRRRTAPTLAADQFPATLVRLQDVPAATDPTGLAAAMAALGTNNIFKDLTGLALNQENAAEALKTSITAAQSFASKAGALAQQRFLNQELDRSIGHIKDARSKGLVTDDQAKSLTESVLRGSLGEARPKDESPTRSASVQRAIDRVATSNNGSLRVTRPEGSVEVKTGASAGRPALDVAVDPPVVPILQLSSLVCWAAGGAMMQNWRSRESKSVETVVDERGGDWRQKYDLNQPLSVAELRAFGAALDMTEEGPQSYSPEGLSRLVEQFGPLLEIGDDGVENNRISHVRIITGVRGDGKMETTDVMLADPASGTNVVERFTAFDRRHGAADPVALSLGIFHF